MQDRYVGDAGDFAKYSLLNALTADQPELSLGILWYLFPNESHNDDGRHVAYLAQPKMALRDPPVHAALASLVNSGARSVEAVERTRILPASTLFFANHVAAKAKPSERKAHRELWFKTGLDHLAGADLLFFDPDNGIETRALVKSDYRAGKYAFWEEIEAAWARGHSLVVYNHLNRSAPASVQTKRLRLAFTERLSGPGKIIPLLFRRGSCRHLWVIAQPRHQKAVIARIGAFLARGWDQDTECDLLKAVSSLKVNEAELQSR